MATLKWFEDGVRISKDRTVSILYSPQKDKQVESCKNSHDSSAGFNILTGSFFIKNLSNNKQVESINWLVFTGKITGKSHRNHGKIWLVSGEDFPFFVCQPIGNLM